MLITMFPGYLYQVRLYMCVCAFEYDSILSILHNLHYDDCINVANVQIITSTTYQQQQQRQQAKDVFSSIEVLVFINIKVVFVNF